MAFNVVMTRLPINGANFNLYAFESTPHSQPDLALVLGDVAQQKSVLTRIHSECLTGDVFGSARCDCGMQLQDMLARIIKNGIGTLIYLRQEGRGIGLMNKLAAYNLQDTGYDTVDANLALGREADERRYEVAAKILDYLRIESIELVTNNPDKLSGLKSLGITVEKRLKSKVHLSSINESYLRIKQQKFHHLIDLPLN